MRWQDVTLIVCLSVFCAACITLCVVLPLYVHPCGSGYTYDVTVQKCRLSCSQEGSENGQTYNYTTHVCECPDYAPVYDATNKMCVPKCSAQEYYSSQKKACVPVVVSCSPAPSVNAATGAINYATHFPRT